MKKIHLLLLALPFAALAQTTTTGTPSTTPPIGSGFGDGTTTAGTTNVGITVPGPVTAPATTATAPSSFGANSYGNSTFTTGNTPVPTGALNSGTPTGALDGGIPGASARTGAGVSGGAVAATPSATPIQRGLSQ